MPYFAFPEIGQKELFQIIFSCTKAYAGKINKTLQNARAGETRSKYDRGIDKKGKSRLLLLFGKYGLDPWTLEHIFWLILHYTVWRLKVKVDHAMPSFQLLI